MTKEINNRIQQPVRQRNEMQAQVERLRTVAERALGALDELKDMCPIDVAVLDKMTADVKAEPAQCLAEHDAALLERVASRRLRGITEYCSGWNNAMQHLIDEGQRIRKEAGK